MSQNLLQKKVHQLTGVVANLLQEVKILQYRNTVTERIMKVKLGLEQEEIDAIVFDMIQEQKAEMAKEQEEAEKVVVPHMAMGQDEEAKEESVGVELASR